MLGVRVGTLLGTPLAFAGGGFPGRGNAGWSSNHASAVTARPSCPSSAASSRKRFSGGGGGGVGVGSPSPTFGGSHGGTHGGGSAAHTRTRPSRHPVTILSFPSAHRQRRAHVTPLRMVEILLEGERAFHV